MENRRKGKYEAVRSCKANFDSGYNCCETVLLSFSEMLDVDCEVIPNIATPFGGGICDRKHMCGALSGAVMAIGLKHGRNDPKGDRDSSSARTKRLVGKFVQKYGSANCRDILDYDPEDPGKIDREKQKTRAIICAPLIEQVAEWLWEELE